MTTAPIASSAPSASTAPTASSSTTPSTAGPSGQFGASLDVMASAAGHVRQVNEEIGAQLGTLMGQLEPIAATWKGAASTAFQHLHARWNGDAQKLNAALLAIADALAGTHRTYTAAEDANHAAASRVAGMING